MKVYFLDYGWLEGDLNWMVSLKTYATKNNKEIYPVWSKFPEYGVLIENENEYILYDTGSNPSDYDRNERFPYYYSNTQGVINQLSILGLKPADIHTVILSHLHDDHCGNVELFQNAEILIDKDEYQYVTNSKKNGHQPKGAYKQFSDTVKHIHLIDCDIRLTEQIKLIRLPGHSHGLLGMFIALDNRPPLFIVSDAIDTHDNYYPALYPSCGIYRQDLYDNSIERIRNIEKTTNAHIIFGHDWDQFKKLPKGPRFY